MVYWTGIGRGTSTTVLGRGSRPSSLQQLVKCASRTIKNDAREKHEPADVASHGTPHLPPTTNETSQSGLLDNIRNAIRTRRSDVEPRLKEQLEALGKRWNEYSGYEEVLEAKALVLASEVRLKVLREEQNKCQQSYMVAVNRRAASQRTLNELLVRKAEWSEADLSKYTELLKAEHNEVRSEREATEQFDNATQSVNKAWDDVVRKTLERYHSEQVWSDRVRAGSTYGSLIVAGINVIIFTLAFLLVEPYKRKKLAQTFEGRLLQGEEQNANALVSVIEQFEGHVSRLEEHNQSIESALNSLLKQTGVRALETSDTESPTAPDETSEPLSGHDTIQNRRREMGLAGALGFAVGAGLLAAFGALQS